MAWLAEVAWTPHTNEGFPGGCPSHLQLADFFTRIPPPPTPDSLGYPEGEDRLPPVSRRWKITYAADLATFRKRAEPLRSLSIHPPR
jgi:hypothetical protein